MVASSLIGKKAETCVTIRSYQMALPVGVNKLIWRDESKTVDLDVSVRSAGRDGFWLSR